MSNAPIINAVRRRRRPEEDPVPLDPVAIALLDETEVDSLRRRGRRSPPFSSSASAVTQPHYRRAADTYAEAPDGTVQIWNGVDKPLRFDAAIGTTENVGVLAPTSAITLDGNGNGPIVGTFTAYLRFVDRSGNFSSLSQISNEYTPETSVGTVTDASYTSPIVITTSASHGLSTGQIVKVDGVFGNSAANGIWQVIVLTSTTFGLYAGGGVASEATGTYVNGGTVTTGVAQLKYFNVATPTESKVVRRQILRNKDGDTSVYYVDIDTTDLTSSTFASSADDVSLVDAVPLEDDNGQDMVDKSLPLTSKKLVAHCLGRMFSSGNEPYSEGAAIVTSGSTTVTGIGTEWGPLTFVGRYFEVQGGSKRYVIENITSQTSLTLTEAYAGSTDPYAYYTISNGPDERRTLYWTPAGQPEAWPVGASVGLAEDPGAGEITALVPLRSWLYVGCENRLYRFSFVNDPLYDGEIVPAGYRGLVNNRVWVKIDDMMYGLDTVGFYQFAGNDLVDISTPGVCDLFRNRPTGPYRINWSAKRNFHAVYDPGESTIRWFVCFGNSYAPQWAVCYQIRIKRWWLEEYPFPIGASCLGRMNGKPQVFLGGDAKRILALHKYSLDAVDPTVGTVNGTVTTSGYDWIADSAASFQTGLAGQEAQIISGTGKGQRRRIVSQSGTTLNMNTPWSIRPDTTSGYQIGGITWRWKSGWLRYIEGPNEMQRAIELNFSPTSVAAGMLLRIYEDLSKTPKTWETTQTLDDGNGIAHLATDPAGDLSIDSTRDGGIVTQRMPNMREYNTRAPLYMAVELGGVSNAEPMSILSVEMDDIGR